MNNHYGNWLNRQSKFRQMTVIALIATIFVWYGITSDVQRDIRLLALRSWKAKVSVTTQDGWLINALNELQQLKKRRTRTTLSNAVPHEDGRK